MTKTRWLVKPGDQGVRFSLLGKKALGEARPLAVRDWEGHLKGQNAKAGVRQMLAWCDEGDAQDEPEAILVPHPLVARLSEVRASALGLPPIAHFSYEITSHGTIDEPKFSLETAWLRMANQPVLGLERTGSFLRQGENRWRLAQPIFGLVEAVEQFRASDTTERGARLTAWEEVQTAIQRASGGKAKVDKYVSTLQFMHAGAFSLKVEKTASGIELDPILFHRQALSSLDTPDGGSDEGEDDAADSAWVEQPEAKSQELDEEGDALLPSAMQEIFLRKRFDLDQACREAYPLARNVFVVFDEDLRRALDVVKEVQRADEARKAAFVKNPRAYLADALGEDRQSAAAALFVETQQYSERVGEMGLWEKPVIPWLERKPNTWLPERFGIQVGPTRLEVKPDEVPLLKEALEAAISAGVSRFEFKGEHIPVDASTRETIERLEAVLRPETPPSEGGGADEPREETSIYALELIDNLEELGLKARPTPRHAVIPGEPPDSRMAVSSLMPHQREGFDWLVAAWKAGRSGVLLADDMGLGKTFQALALLAWVQENRKAAHDGSIRVSQGPILVVAPTSLLHNWLKEVDRHLSREGLGKIAQVFGTKLGEFKRADQPGVGIRVGHSVLDTDRLRGAGWVLTTYETLANYHPSFAQVAFSVAVFDEMQKVKSPDTINTHAAKTVNANFVVGMTGTPIENRLSDLWCIVDRIEPGLLGALRDFSRNYREDDEDSLKRLRAKLVCEEAPAMPALMLRRMKDEVKIGDGLPEKFACVRRRRMPVKQAQAYADAVGRAIAGAGQNRGHMLSVLHELRGISLHPFDPSAVLHDVSKYDEYVGQSARLAETIDILEDIDQRGEKALIFCESRNMQYLVADLLHHRFKLDHRPLVINGSVPAGERMKRVDAFQESGRGFGILILSPKAAGVGLTITAANHVIHLSRWWNPAVEDQCNDRTYRIGQTKPVTIYCPVAVHPEFEDASFDVTLNDLLERKRALARDMLAPPVLGSDIESLFKAATVGAPAAGPVAGEEHGPTIEDLDTMDPVAFEDWARRQLVPRGYETFRTSLSHDCGADGILRNKSTGHAIIIQCKRYAPDQTCGKEAVDDLLRARGAYRLPNAQLVALTTAAGFSGPAKKLAASAGALLLDRSRLAEWGRSIP